MIQEELNENKFSFSKKTGRVIIYTILIIVTLNMGLNFISPPPDHIITNLDGTIASPDEIKKGSFSLLLLGVPFFCVIITFILSFIPYKNLTYNEKYKRFALITLLVLYSIVLGLSILNF